MRCPSCGEDCKESAKFCSNCGTALSAPEVLMAPNATQVASRPVVPFVVSVVAVAGLIVVALSMSFTDDAPGDIGSPVAMLFHSIGAVQLILGLGILTSAIFLMLKGFDVGTWGSVILVLGLVSIAALLLVMVEGTFAVVFLAIPGVLAVVAGQMARRAAASR